MPCIFSYYYIFKTHAKRWNFMRSALTCLRQIQWVGVFKFIQVLTIRFCWFTTFLFGCSGNAGMQTERPVVNIARREKWSLSDWFTVSSEKGQDTSRAQKAGPRFNTALVSGLGRDFAIFFLSKLWTPFCLGIPQGTVKQWRDPFLISQQTLLFTIRWKQSLSVNHRTILPDRKVYYHSDNAAWTQTQHIHNHMYRCVFSHGNGSWGSMNYLYVIWHSSVFIFNINELTVIFTTDWNFYLHLLSFSILHQDSR